MSLQGLNDSTTSLKDILRARQQALHRKSCLPCRERKVRCNKESPCSTCVKRDHADLCTYRDSRAPKLPRHQSPNNGRLSVLQDKAKSPQEHHGNAPVNDGENTATTARPTGDNSQSFLNPTEGENLSLLSDNAIVAIASLRSSFPSDSPARTTAFGTGVLPLLGSSLVNPTTEYSPFSRSALYRAFPKDQLIVKLFEAYRYRNHPFNINTYNLDEIERELCAFMNNRNNNTDHLALPSQSECGFLCLLHALLALGAQFSDLPPEQRFRLSENHIKIAFETLKSANCLARPSKYALQAVILLGNALQNDMKPQAAWVLGGTTIRLAQCLGLHKTSDRFLHSSISNQDASHLRLAVVWQDALLSLAFNRSPVSYDLDHKADLKALDGQGGNLQYCQAVNWLAHIALRYMPSRSSETGPLGPLSLLQSVESIENALSPHLKDRQSCQSIQQVQEFYSFCMHKNFIVATLCRRCISDRLSGSTMTDDVYVREYIHGALRRGAQAYIHLHSLDGYGRRAWAVVHNGLTSVLLLSLMKETRSSPDTRKLQNELLDNLIETDGATTVSLDSTAAGRLSETCRRALEAVKTLKLLAENEDTVGNHQPLPVNSTTRDLPTSLGQVSLPVDEINLSGLPITADWFYNFDNNLSPLSTFDFLLSDPSPEEMGFQSEFII